MFFLFHFRVNFFFGFPNYDAENENENESQGFLFKMFLLDLILNHGFFSFFGEFKNLLVVYMDIFDFLHLHEKSVQNLFKFHVNIFLGCQI
jgi:hypothetical protein